MCLIQSPGWLSNQEFPQATSDLSPIAAPLTGLGDSSAGLVFGQSSKLCMSLKFIAIILLSVSTQKWISWEGGIQLQPLTTTSGKIIPSTNSPIQLMQPTIRKADGLKDWLKISTMTDTVAPAEKEEQNTNRVYLFP